MRHLALATTQGTHNNIHQGLPPFDYYYWMTYLCVRYLRNEEGAEEKATTTKHFNSKFCVFLLQYKISKTQTKLKFKLFSEEKNLVQINKILGYICVF